MRFKLKLYFPFFTKQTILMRRSTVLILPLLLVFPGLASYVLVNKPRGAGSPKIFIHTLWCHNYMRLKFHSCEFDKWGSLKAVFIHFLKNKNISFFNDLRTNMPKMISIISFKLNEKCWRKFKFSSQDIIYISHFCLDVMSQVFQQKLKIKPTKVSKEDFLLVDMD